MRIYENGTYRDAAADEVAEFERMAAETPPPEPTPEERMDEIEAALIELAAMLTGGM